VRAFAAFLIVASATAAALAFVASTGDPPGAPTPRAAPAEPVRADSLFARHPQLGVACHVPNSIRCDRVGFAVWLRRPADSVRAAIAGRRFALHYLQAPTRERMYTGFLRPAGLADGPLRVPFTARGKWFGEGGPSARVRLWIEADGRTRATTVRVPLRAGWG
jgi:hypothetical protein